jgi:uncharacterized caspase-like protein
MRRFRDRRLPLLCLLTLLVAPLFWLRPQRGDLPAGRRYAFLVGVSRYDADVVRELPYSENDVTSLARVLCARGYDTPDVILLTERVGAGASRYRPRLANIRRELRGLLERCRPQDLVLVALTGHGIQFQGDAEQYFLPSDADLRDARSFLPVTELYEELAGCAARHKLLLVDACRDDALYLNAPGPAGRRPAGRRQRPVLPPPGSGVAAFFSCSADEISFEDDGLQRSIFLHFIIEGLKGGAAGRDRRVTLPSLQQYVTGRVSAFVRARYEFCEQTPQGSGRWAAPVPLVRPNKVTSRRGHNGNNEIDN